MVREADGPLTGTLWPTRRGVPHRHRRKAGLRSASAVLTSPTITSNRVGSMSRSGSPLTPGALHAGLRRTGDLYGTPLDQAVDQLSVEGAALTPTARVRLVAFAGHGAISVGTTVNLGDAARFIRSHLQTHHDLYRVTRFSDPVVALLALLDKLP